VIYPPNSFCIAFPIESNVFLMLLQAVSTLFLTSLPHSSASRILTWMFSASVSSGFTGLLDLLELLLQLLPDEDPEANVPRLYGGVL